MKPNYLESRATYAQLISPRVRVILYSVMVVLFAALASGKAAAEATSVENSRADKRDLHVVVKPGDSLNAILLRELESAEDWKVVARHNKIDAPEKLLPGDVIVIPHNLLQKRNYAQLVYVKGFASLTRAVTRAVEKVKKGARVFVGDAIKTGRDGFVSLTFRDSSLVNIQPDSDIVIEKLDCFDKTQSCLIGLRAPMGQLNLDVGRADFQKPTLFTIETPYASAAVRGTRFDFDVLEGSVLGVTEGEVEVVFAGETAVVGMGKGTLAGKGQSVSKLYDLLVAPEFKEHVNFERISSEDFLHWDAVQNAQKYLVSFATDEAMTNVSSTIANSVSEPAATVVESTLQPGDYFIAVRGVDKNGLKGFPAKKKMRQLAIGKEIGPELDIQIVDQRLDIKSDSGNPLEIRIGNALQFALGLDRLLEYKSYQLEPGKTLELAVDTGQDWYVIAREVLSDTAVSRYSGLYEYKANR